MFHNFSCSFNGSSLKQIRYKFGQNKFLNMKIINEFINKKNIIYNVHNFLFNELTPSEI